MSRPGGNVQGRKGVSRDGRQCPGSGGGVQGREVCPGTGGDVQKREVASRGGESVGETNVRTIFALFPSDRSNLTRVMTSHVTSHTDSVHKWAAAWDVV